MLSIEIAFLAFIFFFLFRKCFAFDILLYISLWRVSNAVKKKESEREQARKENIKLKWTLTFPSEISVSIAKTWYSSIHAQWWFANPLVSCKLIKKIRFKEEEEELLMNWHYPDRSLKSHLRISFVEVDASLFLPRFINEEITENRNNKKYKIIQSIFHFWFQWTFRIIFWEKWFLFASSSPFWRVSVLFLFHLIVVVYHIILSLISIYSAGDLIYYVFIQVYRLQHFFFLLPLFRFVSYFIFICFFFLHIFDVSIEFISKRQMRIK